MLKASDKYVIDSKGPVHTLTIKEVDGRDVGLYSASCKNKTTEAKLSVEGMYYKVMWLG